MFNRGKSLPARGVWIEIGVRTGQNRRSGSRSPQGECGLKFKLGLDCILDGLGRSPQGECGLKCEARADDPLSGKSLPARGVWIEINLSWDAIISKKSLPARGVWIEITATRTLTRTCGTSLPARGVWIEISSIRQAATRSSVAPRKGSVD